jgi:PIN domain nuclease of toxin-antitoxin system
VRLLLDTHALLWFLTADRRLGRRARGLIEAPANTAMISIVSLWEIALKSRLGKLHLDFAAIMDAVGRTDFENLGLTETHLRILAGLPNVTDHRDPFDHLLIAQAQAEDLIFVSDDRWVRNYAIRFEPCSGAQPG